MPVIQDQQFAESPEAERNLIEEFRRWCKVPSWMQDAVRKMEAARRYVHTDAFHHDDPNAVAVNALHAKIKQRMAMVWPKDPEPKCKPPEQIPLPDDGDPMMAALSAQMSKMQERVADTAAAVLKHLGKEANLADALKVAGLDADVTGICFIKAGWQEDSTRDFLGRKRHNDQQDQLALLRELSREYAQGTFDSSDFRYQQLLDLSEYARQAASRVMVAPGSDPREGLQQIADSDPGMPVPFWLIPEPEKFRTATCDVVRLENLRLDWGAIWSPHLHRYGSRTGERVWWKKQDVAAHYKLTDEERAKLGSRQLGGGINQANQAYGSKAEAQEPGSEGLDDVERTPDEVALWEIFDYDTDHRYVYAEGLDRFLIKEPISLRNRLRSPYIPIFWDAVSGRFLPLGAVEKCKSLQEEITSTLTDYRDARIARYAKYLADDQVVDEDAALAIERSRPNRVTRVAGSAKALKDSIEILQGVPLERETYDSSDAMSSMNELMSVPSEANGRVSSPQFAKQIEVVQQAMMTQAEQMAEVMLSVMRDWFTCVLDYMATYADEKWIKKIAGPGALWPLFDRETIVRGLSVDVVAAGTPAQRQEAITSVNEVADAAMKLLTVKQQAAVLGYDFDIEPLMQRVLRGADVRMPVGRILRKLDLMSGGIPGQMPMGGNPQQAAAQAAQAGAGPMRARVPTPINAG